MKAHHQHTDQPYSYFGQYYEYKNRYETAVQEKEYWKDQCMQLRHDLHDITAIINDSEFVEFTVQRSKDRMFPV